MEYGATISVAGGEELDTLYAAFLPEKKGLKAERAHYTIKREKGAVVFEVSAGDAVAFRAAVSAISKMLSVIEKVRKV